MGEDIKIYLSAIFLFAVGGWRTIFNRQDSQGLDDICFAIFITVFKILHILGWQIESLFLLFLPTEQKLFGLQLTQIDEMTVRLLYLLPISLLPHIRPSHLEFSQRYLGFQ